MDIPRLLIRPNNTSSLYEKHPLGLETELRDQMDGAGGRHF